MASSDDAAAEAKRRAEQILAEEQARVDRQRGRGKEK